MAETQAAPPATVEINDAIFCTHFKEVCAVCAFDGREENDSFFGFDFIDREGIDCPPATQNKDGVYQCKKHGSACTSLSLLLPFTCLNSVFFSSRRLIQLATNAMDGRNK
ncbi:hypothetical protein CPB84DRAFT_1712959 [Gymnopilus junonius]|uniref:Uncharacterized protein n=1 Tax=Gymnopilus junonius TaxID=109634 RepID=A0A9P5NGE7_GYMJU|nr:hypothetical protein CPB84DRAFT_1712959 [Gymnopilus junonius]